MNSHGHTCYQCGKTISGKMILTSPPLYLIRLRLDFQKSFHPACFRKAEMEAEQELRKA